MSDNTEITITQTADSGARFIHIERDGVPVVGVETDAEGRITVGCWINDEDWKVLHVIAPAGE